MYSKTMMLFLGLMIIGGLKVSFAFEQFEFGDSPTTIKSKYQQECRLSKIYPDMQWLWLKALICKNYQYKGINTKLIFEFDQNKLVRTRIVSVDLTNYFLIREKNSLLIPKYNHDNNRKVAGYHQPLLNDRVHRYGPSKVLTYFYHKKKWEWDLIIEDPKYSKKEMVLKKQQLESFKGQGVKGWTNFKFNDSVTKIKDNLEGLCSKIEIDNKSYLSGKKIISCHRFPFASQKIMIDFTFIETRFVEATLYLSPKDYSVMNPLLKQKYGKPYLEAVDSEDHFPFLYFSKHNILLAFQKSQSDSTVMQLVLKYTKEGYFDDSRPVPAKQLAPTQQKKPVHKTDNIKEKKGLDQNTIILNNL